MYGRMNVINNNTVYMKDGSFVMKDGYSQIDKIIIALVVLFSLYCLEPYFIWDTYAGGTFRYLFGIVPYKTIFGIIFIILSAIKYLSKPIKYNQFLLSVGVFVVAIFTVGLAGGNERSQIFSFAWLPYFVVIAYINLPARIQYKAYDVFLTVFAVSLILPILYWVLFRIGKTIPYTWLDSYEEIKIIRGHYYKLYPLASQRVSIYDPLVEIKLSGIFDESGRVGTLCGLFLASERFRLKGKWRNIVMMIAGFLSFSLAFFIIGIIYYICKCVELNKIKNISIVVLIIVIYIGFINIDFSDPTLSTLQNRIIITESGLVGDNRTNDAFDALMDDFNRSDLYTRLFGAGDGAIGEIQASRNIDGSSYKCMIYNFGYVGYGLSIIWLVMYGIIQMKQKRSDRVQMFSLLVLYLANMYQRPSVFYMGYLLIMFGGMVKAYPEYMAELKVSKRAGIKS